MELLLALILFPLSAQQKWEKTQIEDIFELLDNGNVDGAISYVERFSVTPYDFGRDLILIGEPQKAKTWYQKLAIVKDEHQYLFGAAYAQWSMGDTHGALEDAGFILSQNPPPLIEARTCYLMGQVCLATWQLDDAENYFRNGLKIYKEMGDKFGGEYLCYIMLATVAANKKNFNTVSDLLANALKANQKSIEAGYKSNGMGTYHEILGEMYFWQGDYVSALEENYQSYDLYTSEGKSAWAEAVETKIGLLQLLTGNPKAAYEIAVDINERVRGKEEKARIAAYNNVTLMFLYFCANMEQQYNFRRKAALEWADSVPGGEDLKRLLNLDFTCPPVK